MLRQRTVDGLTLREIADHHNLTQERIRQILAYYFRVRGVPLAAVARRRKKAAAKTEARLDALTPRDKPERPP